MSESPCPTRRSTRKCRPSRRQGAPKSTVEEVAPKSTVAVEEVAQKSCVATNAVEEVAAEEDTEEDTEVAEYTDDAEYTDVAEYTEEDEDTKGTEENTVKDTKGKDTDDGYGGDDYGHDGYGGHNDYGIESEDESETSKTSETSETSESTIEVRWVNQFVFKIHGTITDMPMPKFTDVVYVYVYVHGVKYSEKVGNVDYTKGTMVHLMKPANLQPDRVMIRSLRSLYGPDPPVQVAQMIEKADKASAHEEAPAPEQAPARIHATRISTGSHPATSKSIYTMPRCDGWVFESYGAKYSTVFLSEDDMQNMKIRRTLTVTQKNCRDVTIRNADVSLRWRFKGGRKPEHLVKGFQFQVKEGFRPNERCTVMFQGNEVDVWDDYTGKFN